ncbi:MFS transporter [Chloroflexota bacterium]
MRKYLVFAIIVLPVFISHFASTAVSVAFPTIVSHFGTSLVLAGWVLNIYILVTIGSIPVTAKLSDTVGRRATFMVCLGSFTIGSFLCSIAPDIGWLIFFRVIQAIGGGGFISAATGIVIDEYPAMRQRLIGLTVSVATFGAIAGPNIGGVIVEYLGWQSIFWVNVPIMIITMVLAKRFIKADVKGGSPREIDFPGVGLLLGFSSAMVISVTLLDKAYHIPSTLIVLLALLGILFLVMFVYRCKNHQGAVFSFQMLADRPFLAANLFNFAYGACAENGVMSLLPLYAVSVYGLGVLESGLAVTPRSLGVFAISIVASLSIMKWGYRRPIILGTLVIALGLVLLALEPGVMTLGEIGLPPIAIVMLLALVVGIGGGMVNPTANNASVDLMPEKAASITGLRQIFRRIGQTTGIAVSTLVLESSASIPQGFTRLFIGFAILTLVSIVAVFSIPARPKR